MHDFTICRANFYDLDIRFEAYPLYLNMNIEVLF